VVPSLQVESYLKRFLLSYLQLLVFFVASILLLLWLYIKEGNFPRLSLRQWGLTFFAGVTGIFLYNIFFFAALAEIPAGRTALLVSLNPIFTAIILFIFFKERLSGVHWFGIILALFGVTIVISHGDMINTLVNLSNALGKGELLMLGAVLSWSIYTILGRFTLKNLNPLVATTYATCIGFILLLLVTLYQYTNMPAEVFIELLTWKNTTSILYLGILGTVLAFVWYYQGVAVIGASRAAIFTNLVPVFGVLLGFFFLKEPILWSMFIGGVITIIGVTITNYK